jgi:hypothetical protein
MGMLYPRTIEVHRLKTNAGPTDSAVGLVGYSGAEQSTSPSDAQGETVLFTGISASIQAGATGRKKNSSLPQDVIVQPTWIIMTPKRALKRGSVRDRDIVIDDESYRYEVGQAYWNLLGYRLICIRLEA